LGNSLLGCVEAGIAEQTYYRWRKEYDGMQTSDAARLKALEKENARLKKSLQSKYLITRFCAT